MTIEITQTLKYAHYLLERYRRSRGRWYAMRQADLRMQGQGGKFRAAWRSETARRFETALADRNRYFEILVVLTTDHLAGGAAKRAG